MVSKWCVRFYDWITGANEAELTKYQKFTRYIGVCFFAVLLGSFMLTLTGTIDLRIVNDIEVSPLFNYSGLFLMFMINMFFVFSITLKLFDYRIWWLLLCYVPIYALNVFVGNNLVSTFLIPLVFASTAYCVINKKSNPLKFVVRFVSFSILILAYQYISAYIKVAWLADTIMVQFNNALTLFIYSIDLYLIYTLAYMGVRQNAREIPSRGFRQTFCICKEALLGFFTFDHAQPVHELTKFQKLLFYTLAFGWFLFSMSIIILIGHIFASISVVIIIWLAFELGRPILGKTYHAQSLLVCTFISTISFFILSKLAFPLEHSLFWGVVLAAAFTLVLHIYVTLHDELVHLRKKEKAKKVNIKVIPESAFDKFDNEQLEIIKRIQRGEKIEKIWQEMHTSESTVKRRIREIKKIYAPYI